MLGEGRGEPEVVLVTSVAGWASVQVKAISPLTAAAVFPRLERPTGIVQQATKVRTLVKAAAENAFGQLGLPQLKALMLEISCAWVGKRPTSVKDVVSCLVRHIFPEMPQAEVDKLVASRGSRRPGVSTVLAEGHNSELVAEFLEPDEQKHIEELAAATRKSSGSGSGAASASPAAAGGRPSTGTSSASSSSAAGGPAPPDAPRRVRALRAPLQVNWASLSTDEVRKHLPAVSGIGLLREVSKWASRWRVTYPRSELPKPFSQVFSCAAT